MCIKIHTETQYAFKHEVGFFFFKLKLLVADTVGLSRHSLQIKKCRQLPNSNIENINIQDDFFKYTRKQEWIHDTKIANTFKQQFRLKSVFSQSCIYQHLLRHIYKSI